MGDRKVGRQLGAHVCRATPQRRAALASMVPRITSARKGMAWKLSSAFEAPNHAISGAANVIWRRAAPAPDRGGPAPTSRLAAGSCRIQASKPASRDPSQAGESRQAE